MALLSRQGVVGRAQWMIGGNLFFHLARLENAKTYPVGDNGNGQNNGADGDDPDP